MAYLSRALIMALLALVPSRANVQRQQTRLELTRTVGTMPPSVSRAAGFAAFRLPCTFGQLQPDG